MGLDAEREVQADFSGIGFSSGGEFYLPSTETTRYLEKCRRNGFAVVGVEGFHIFGGKVRPCMDMIADFSDLFKSEKDGKCRIEKSHLEARNFLAKFESQTQVWWNFALLRPDNET